MSNKYCRMKYTYINYYKNRGDLSGKNKSGYCR